MLLDIAISIVGGQSVGDGEVLEEEDINILDNTDQTEGKLGHGWYQIICSLLFQQSLKNLQSLRSQRFLLYPNQSRSQQPPSV